MKTSQLHVCVAVLGCVLANTVVEVVGPDVKCEPLGCTYWGTPCPKQGCDVMGNPCPSQGCRSDEVLVAPVTKPPKPKHLISDVLNYGVAKFLAITRHEIYTQYNVNASAVSTFLERVPQWLNIQYYWDPSPQRRAALLQTYPRHFINMLVNYTVTNRMVYSSAVPKIVYVPQPSVSLNVPNGPASLNQPPTLPGVSLTLPDDEGEYFPHQEAPDEGAQELPDDALDKFLEENPFGEAGSIDKFCDFFKRFFGSRVQPQNVPAADDLNDANPSVDSPALDDAENNLRQATREYKEDNFTPPKEGDADGDADGGDAADADADAADGEAGLAGVLTGILVG